VLRIRISWIRIFLGILDPDPDPVVRDTDPDPDLSTIYFLLSIKNSKKKSHIPYFFVTSL